MTHLAGRRFDRFIGCDMTLIISSTQGRTLIDVPSTNDHSLIVEHMEVSPNYSQIDFLGPDENEGQAERSLKRSDVAPKAKSET